MFCNPCCNGYLTDGDRSSLVIIRTGRDRHTHTRPNETASAILEADGRVFDAIGVRPVPSMLAHAVAAVTPSVVPGIAQGVGPSGKARRKRQVLHRGQEWDIMATNHAKPPRHLDAGLAWGSGHGQQRIARNETLPPPGLMRAICGPGCLGAVVVQDTAWGNAS